MLTSASHCDHPGKPTHVCLCCDKAPGRDEGMLTSRVFSAHQRSRSYECLAAVLDGLDRAEEATLARSLAASLAGILGAIAPT